MANVNVTLRMDAELKNQATELFKDLGLTLNSAFNVFARQAVREQRIPFEVTREEVPNETTLAAIQECEKMLSDQNINGVSTEEAFKEFDSWL